MTIQAAVSRMANGPLSIEELDLEGPRDNEILVRMNATGVCHTDIAVIDRILPTPQPVVLGHEGAGVVEEVGDRIEKVSPGDPVVMTFNSCGQCPCCLSGQDAYCHKIFEYNFAVQPRADGSSRLLANNEPVHSDFFGQSSFATYSLCHERNIVKVTGDAPLEKLGPLGCSIQTGAGAVMNALQIPPGAPFAVFGAGSVGTAAIMAAWTTGVSPIIAVDTNEARLTFAKEVGATHAINPSTCDVTAEIQNLTHYGLDFVLDTTGLSSVIRQATEALAPKGLCGVLGASELGSEIVLDEVHFMTGGRRLMGIVEGESVPDIFIPKLLELYQQGRFPFDRMLDFYSFNQINQAIADSRAGRVLKPVVQMR